MYILRALVLVTSFMLITGCFKEEQSQNEIAGSKSKAYDTSAQIVSSKPADKDCDEDRKGALVYSLGDAQFYACDAAVWAMIDLKGAKGDKGDKGDQGIQGVAGTDGVNGEQGPMGPQGPKGEPGLSGVAGEGAPGLVISDGSNILAHFIQFLEWGSFGINYWPGDTSGHFTSPLLVRLVSTGEFLVLNQKTGGMLNMVSVISYLQPDCSGPAYLDFLTGLKHGQAKYPVGLIFASVNTSGIEQDYWKVTSVVDSATNNLQIQSVKQFHWETATYTCKNYDPNYLDDIHADITSPDTSALYKSRVVLSIAPVSAPQSFRSLAPISLTTTN